MATPSPSKRVSYFTHFPHYFIKPYGRQQRVNTNADILAKLNGKNCEWLLRPNVAISECAQTVQENMDIVQNSTIFSNEVKQSLDAKLAPLNETFNHLNSNDKTTTATPQDIFNVMSFAIDGDENFDNDLAEMMHSASALYVAAVQMRAMRAIMTHTETYANKIASDEPSVIARSRILQLCNRYRPC